MNHKTVIKHFSQLSTSELYEIIKLRVEIFVVEQKIIYQDLDDIDKDAYHIFLRDNDNIVAYLRIFRKYDNSNEFIIGRVLSTKRKCGYASLIINEAVKFAKEKLNAGKISLHAQKYIISMYEKLGFKQISDEFMEENILHVEMQMDLR